MSKKEFNRVIVKTGEKVSLGLFLSSDARQLAHWINNEEMREFLSTYLPISIEQEEEWIKKVNSNPSDNMIFAIVLNDSEQNILGTIGLHHISHKNRTATIGMLIGDQEHRERGVGTEAGKLLIDYAFNILNLRKLKAEAFAHNKRSLALIKKLGGIEEGIFKEQFFINGRYVDAISLAIFKPE